MLLLLDQHHRLIVLEAFNALLVYLLRIKLIVAGESTHYVLSREPGPNFGVNIKRTKCRGPLRKVFDAYLLVLNAALWAWDIALSW